VNIYEKLFDILIAICIMLIFPMMYLTKKSQLITYQAIQNDTEQFVEEILTQGKLSKEAYEGFHEGVNAYDEAIQIIFSYEEIVFEPEYQLDQASGDYLFTGKVMEYDQITSGYEIVNSLYQKEAGFFMEPGGYFKVTIQFINKDQAIYCGGTVRAYFSFCDYICNNCNNFYYNQRYLVCTA
jgi:hypothetical protein